MKVLIIGGTNKTAINVAKELESNGCTIDGITYRDNKKIVDDFNNWMHLDFFDDHSVNKFLISQENKKYDKIVLFIANSTQIFEESLNYKREILRQFYGIFCVNYLLLINTLSKCLSSSGSIIFISSSAADTGCNDLVYSSSKALIQSYVLSLNNLLNKEQSAFSILPSTIYGSNFYESLPENHYIKLETEVMTYPKNIADIIMESNQHKGKNIKLGWGKGW